MNLTLLSGSTIPSMSLVMPYLILAITISCPSLMSRGRLKVVIQSYPCEAGAKMNCPVSGRKITNIINFQ